MLKTIAFLAAVFLPLTAVHADEREQVRNSFRGSVFELRSSDLHEGESIAISLPFDLPVVQAMAQAMQLLETEASPHQLDKMRVMRNLHEAIAKSESFKTSWFYRNDICSRNSVIRTDFHVGNCLYKELEPFARVTVRLSTLLLNGGVDSVSPAFSTTDGAKRFHIGESTSRKTYKSSVVYIACFDKYEGFLRAGEFDQDQERLTGNIGINYGYRSVRRSIIRDCKYARGAEIVAAINRMIVPLHVFYDVQGLEAGARFDELKYPAVTNFSSRKDGNWNASAFSFLNAMQQLYN